MKPFVPLYGSPEERRAHCEKPDTVRAMRERVSPALDLELFRRKRVDGWTVWGDEVAELMRGGVIGPDFVTHCYRLQIGAVVLGD